MELIVVALICIGLGAPFAAILLALAASSRAAGLKSELAALGARVDMHTVAGTQLNQRVAAIEAALARAQVDRADPARSDDRTFGSAPRPRHRAAAPVPSAPPGSDARAAMDPLVARVGLAGAAPDASAPIAGDLARDGRAGEGGGGAREADASDLEADVSSDLEAGATSDLEAGATSDLEVGATSDLEAGATSDLEADAPAAEPDPLAPATDPGADHAAERDAAEPTPQPVAEAAPDHDAGGDDVAAGEPAAKPRGAPVPPAAPGRSAEGAAPVAWEQWLGVRGAAALGAAVLILAGIYFFRYSVERGLIGPGLRVTLGALAGLGCIAGAERFVRSRHALLANCLVGAGVALSYLSAWAASAQFALVPHVVAGGAMIAITALCCWLSVKRASVAIAVFGLLGGFATPVMLSQGSDAPVALFSYLLLLDVALLYVAHVRRWPLLAVLSLVGTTAYQGLWIVGRMGPDRVGWGMMICVGFGIVFAMASAHREDAAKPTEGWGFTRAAAVLLPFVFALYAGLSAELDVGLAALCLYLGVLCAGAFFVARRDGVAWLGLSGTCAALGVLASWLLSHAVGDEAVIALVALGLVVHGFVELEARRGEVATETALAGLAWNAGASLIGAFVALRAEAPLPWLAGGLVFALAGLRIAAIARRPWLALPHGLAAGFGLIALAAGDVEAPIVVAAGAVALAAVTHAASLLARREGTRAATAIALAAFVALAIQSELPGPLHVALLILAAATVVAGVRRHGGSAWLVLANLAAVGAVMARATATDELGVAYVAQALVAALFTFAPAMRPREARTEPLAFLPGALAALFALAPMVWLHEELFGDSLVGLTPLALAALPVALTVALARLVPGEGRRAGATQLGAAAIVLVTIAMPLQLDREALTIAWALEALALLGLWRRLDHGGLKYTALALFGVVSFRLVLVDEVAGYHPRSDLPIANWLATTYLVPALCLALGALCLRGLEAARLRAWERPVGTPFLIASAIVLVFVWLNLTIIDAFAETKYLMIGLDRMPSRDLTLSLAWALYALALLALGTWRASRGLRVGSLVLMIATCAKVFLGDLAHLEDLHRVMSLVGLAASLIAVSFAYKRFIAAPDP